MSDADVTWFVNWGHSHNVKVLGCIWNTSSWSWSLATNAFRVHQSAFVQAIVAECKRINLDGVDLDFEGDDANNQPIDNATDRNAYIAFCDSLAYYLHPLGKVVTVASFSGQWNAPNWNYWSALLPVVDGICTMGYDGSSSNSDYGTQKSHATADLAHFMIGMPGWVSNWGGLDVNTQVDWITNNSPIGLGIWDASLAGGGNWQTAQVWNKIKAIKNRAVTPVVAEVKAKPQADEYNFKVSSDAPSGMVVTATIQKESNVRAEIFDSRGSKMADLFSGPVGASPFCARWNGITGGGFKVASGSYIVRLVIDNKIIRSRQFTLFP